MGLRADSARPQRVSGSARTDSRRAESARNPIAVAVWGYIYISRTAEPIELIFGM